MCGLGNESQIINTPVSNDSNNRGRKRGINLEPVCVVQVIAVGLGCTGEPGSTGRFVTHLQVVRPAQLHKTKSIAY